MKHYSSSAAVYAEAAAQASTKLTLNFTTPHAPIYTKKEVDQVVLPGAAGEYGITAGHSPIISELKPGVVSVIHVGVRFLNTCDFLISLIFEVSKLYSGSNGKVFCIWWIFLKSR